MSEPTRSRTGEGFVTLRMFGRYAGGIRGFLKQPLGSEECRRIVLNQKARREESFLAMLERFVETSLAHQKFVRCLSSSLG